jgi:hypothetical protein
VKSSSGSSTSDSLTGSLNNSGSVFDFGTYTPLTYEEIVAYDPSPPIGQYPGSGDALGLSNCWVVLQSPNTKTSICLHRTSTESNSGDATWYIYYTRDPHSFGDGTLTDPDTTSAGITLVNNTVFGTNTLFHGAADSEESPGGSNGFVFLTLRAGNDLDVYFSIEDLRNVPANRDASEIIQFIKYTANLLYNNVTPYGKALMNVGTAAERWGDVICPYLSSSTRTYPDNVVEPISFWDSKEYYAEIPTGFTDETYMGTLRWLAWPSDAHDYPNTGASKQHLFMDGLLILNFFDGVTTPTSI